MCDLTWIRFWTKEKDNYKGLRQNNWQIEIWTVYQILVLMSHFLALWFFCGYVRKHLCLQERHMKILIKWCYISKLLSSFFDNSYIDMHMHVSEKAMATHSSTLAWKIPWMEKPGRQFMGLLRVRHDWATSLSLFSFMHWRRKWQPTQVFLPGESQGRGSLVGCRLWGRTESDTPEAT